MTIDIPEEAIVACARVIAERTMSEGELRWDNKMFGDLQITALRDTAKAVLREGLPHLMARILKDFDGSSIYINDDGSVGVRADFSYWEE